MITQTELQSLATEVEKVLYESHEDAKAFYEANADTIAAALDAALEFYPEDDSVPMDQDALDLTLAAEELGERYAALAAYVLTGKIELEDRRFTRPRRDD